MSGNFTRFEVKVGKVGKAKNHAKYVLGIGAYARKTNEIEYSKSGNLPHWAKDAVDFFGASDEYERANGTAYREHIINLPRALSVEQRKALVDDWVQRELGDKHAYCYAIHNPKSASDGGEQPHVHIMFSERTHDGIDRPRENYFKRANKKSPEKGGCPKSNSTQKKHSERVLELENQRFRWWQLAEFHLFKTTKLKLSNTAKAQDKEKRLYKPTGIYQLQKRTNEMIAKLENKPVELQTHLMQKDENREIHKSYFKDPPKPQQKQEIQQEQKAPPKPAVQQPVRQVQKVQRNDDYDLSM